MLAMSFLVVYKCSITYPQNIYRFDRSLPFKSYLEKLQLKLNIRNNIATYHSVFSTVQYWTPILRNIMHLNNVETQLNECINELNAL